MDSIPTKDAQSSCVCCLCNSDKAHHLTAIRKKGSSLLHNIGICLQIELREEDADLKICVTCVRRITAFSDFKKRANVILNDILSRADTQRSKRCHRTPASEKKVSKKPRAQSVIEFLSNSVEKLKLSESRAVPTAERQKTARKKLIPSSESENEGPEDLGDFSSSFSNISEHSYSTPSHSTENETTTRAKDALEECRIYTDEECGKRVLGRKDREQLCKAIAEETEINRLAFLITKCGPLLFAVKQYILKDIEASLQSKFSKKTSVMFSHKTEQLLDNNLFASIILEMKSNVPYLLDIISVCCRGPVDGSKITMIATIFSMMMQKRVKQASAVQRLYTAMCLRYHANNKLLTRLNVVHLTLSQNSKVNIIKDFGTYSKQTVIDKVRQGCDGKFNGDNLDFRVTTGAMRLTSRNRNSHFFATDWTPDRVKLSELASDRPCGDADRVSVDTYCANVLEHNKFKEDLKILIAKDFVEIFPCFSWMKLLLPDAIPHELSAEMSTRSYPCILPILLKNEAKYSDCISILCSYETQAKEWYTEAGRGLANTWTLLFMTYNVFNSQLVQHKHMLDFTDLRIPVGGDQLTRVRLQGAKHLRAGSHTAEERFDHLDPMIVELFHTIQDFPEKLCKKFLKIPKGREIGTLANLRVNIQRTNVNGEVKVHFKAHEDFVMTAGKAYVTELAMEHFQMDTKDSSPMANKPAPNVHMFQRQRRQAAFNQIMDPFVAKFITPFQIHDENITQETVDEVKLKLNIGQNQVVAKAKISADRTRATLQLAIGSNQSVCLHIPLSLLEKGNTISAQIHGLPGPVVIQKIQDEPDDLYNYAMNFIQWYFVLRNMKDAIKQGDMGRTNIGLKLMIPFFYLHSKLSKYLVECMDYILKTEVLLTPQQSLQVRAASFINRKGKPGKNKPADMEKENQVKYLKELIRGLGPGKTEKAVVNISKAGPVIRDVVTNFDEIAGVKELSSAHKCKSSTEDLESLREHLRKIRPFRKTPGRQLPSFQGIAANPFENLNKAEFTDHIEKTSDRLKRNQPIVIHEGNEAEDDQ